MHYLRAHTTFIRKYNEFIERLFCNKFLKALILLGDFTLVGLSLAIWPRFAKFANVSTRQSFQFYSTIYT